MEAVQIRETLHEYIDTVDEKKLEAIYTVLKDSISPDFTYTGDELSGWLRGSCHQLFFVGYGFLKDYHDPLINP